MESKKINQRFAHTIFSNKILFFNQYFDILEFRDKEDKLLGYYCDIVTPVEKHNGEYYIIDLFLDIWITPGRQLFELDLDEFYSACNNGIISDSQRDNALSFFERVKSEFYSDVFPWRYIE